jgi:predicted DNA-binding transcriptional regulator
MKLNVLFSSKDRIRILEGIVFRESVFGVSEISRELKLSKGLISKYLNSLTREGLLKKSNGKFAVDNNANTRTVRILLNINSIRRDVFKK